MCSSSSSRERQIPIVYILVSSWSLFYRCMDSCTLAEYLRDLLVSNDDKSYSRTRTKKPQPPQSNT